MEEILKLVDELAEAGLDAATYLDWQDAAIDVERNAILAARDDLIKAIKAREAL
jgi:hypothetical protein